MKNVLHIISSARGSQSYSKGLSSAIVKKLIDKNVVKVVVEKNLVEDFPPFIDQEGIKELYKNPEAINEDGNLLLNYSDIIFDEMKQADIIVIGTPMHNFGISAPLKAWIDQFIRIGKTYALNNDGTKAYFLKDKKVYLAIASGGKTSESSNKDEYIESYIKAVFSTYAGIIDISTFRIEGTVYPDFKENYEEIIQNL